MTNDQFTFTPRATGETEALSLSQEKIVRTGDGTSYLLVLQQQYVIVRAEGRRGDWKVRTQAYWYEVQGGDGRGEFSELAAWHWHPATKEKRPHLHVQHGHLSHLHLVTGRVSIEGVLRFLLAELGVNHRRDDWEAVLEEAEGPFEEWRTWSGSGPSREAPPAT